jgi:hypothetical protein
VRTSECQWQHPVEFLPDLRLGATIYAHLNPQAKAFALGKVVELDPPHSFAFRWTTTNPRLPPDFVIGYTVRDGMLRVRSGPLSAKRWRVPIGRVDSHTP